MKNKKLLFSLLLFLLTTTFFVKSMELDIFKSKSMNNFFVDRLEAQELKKLMQEAKQAYRDEPMKQAVLKRVSDITKNALIGNDEARSKLLVLNTLFKKLYLENHSSFIVSDQATGIIKFMGKDLNEITNFKPTSFKQLVNHNFIVDCINKQANRVFTSTNATEQALSMHVIDGLLKAQALNQNGQIHLIEKFLASCKQLNPSANSVTTAFLSTLPNNSQHSIEYIKERVFETSRLGDIILDATLGQLFRAPEQRAQYVKELKIAIFQSSDMKFQDADIQTIGFNITKDLIFDGGASYFAKISSKISEQVPEAINNLASAIERSNIAKQRLTEACHVESQTTKLVTNNKIEQMDSIEDMYNISDLMEPDISMSLKEDLCDEGFIAGTKIKTLEGLKAIEDIKVGDMIAGYDPLEGFIEKPILDISKKQIKQYIKISIENEIVYAAPNQKFYLPQENKWVDAKNIRPSDVVLIKQTEYSLIKNVEIIQGSTSVHAITVDDHNFYITSNDILVHNMNAAVVTDKVINVIGRLILSDPVRKLLGSANNLASACFALHKTMSPQNMQVVETPVKINLIPERIQYEKMRADLCKLRNEFLEVKQNLEDIVKSSRPSEVNFTNEFLNPIRYRDIPKLPLKLIPSQESEYNDEEKKYLRDLRQLELDQIKQQILDVQSDLAFHFDELIDARDKALSDYYKVTNPHDKSVNMWNLNLDNVPLDTALSLYENVFAHKTSLENLESKNQELKIAIDYYKNTKSNSVLERTTNIRKLIDKEEKEVASVESIVSINKEINRSNQEIVEKHLLKSGVRLEFLVDDLNCNLKQQRQFQRAKRLAEANNKIDSQKSYFSKPPEDPKKNDKDKKQENHTTNKQDKEDAEKLGYKLDKNPPFDTHKKLAFKKDQTWISGDRDVHNGGRWKMYNRKGERIGTFDKDLRRIK